MASHRPPGISRGHPHLAADQRDRAKHRFYSIVNHFRAADASDGAYSRPLLIRYTYEYSLSELSQDTFLRAFFDCIGLDIAGEEDPDFGGEEGNRLSESFASFADFLLDNFFIPLKASGDHTAQPSPAAFSAIQRAQGKHDHLATPDRVAALRDACLVRDHRRCVISRRFDQKEAISRFTQHGDSAQDDEGNQLRGQSFAILEVAHIIPHSLAQSDTHGQLNDTQKAALSILNMFDCDVSHLIGGADIDRPFNAMSLTRDFHTNFGNFSVFFEPVPGQEHTYRIDTFLPAGVLPELPVTRTLYLTNDRSVDPLSPRLLAIHRAVAYILHLSGAGEYIDKILQDTEDLGAREGGATELGRIVTLKLGGWFGSAVSA